MFYNIFCPAKEDGTSFFKVNNLTRNFKEHIFYTFYIIKMRGSILSHKRSLCQGGSVWTWPGTCSALAWSAGQGGGSR